MSPKPVTVPAHLAMPHGRRVAVIPLWLRGGLEDLWPWSPVSQAESGWGCVRACGSWDLMLLVPKTGAPVTGRRSEMPGEGRRVHV